MRGEMFILVHVCKHTALPAFILYNASYKDNQDMQLI